MYLYVSFDENVTPLGCIQKKQVFRFPTASGEKEILAKIYVNGLYLS